MLYVSVDLADDSTSVTEDESQVFQAEGGEGEDKSGEEPPAADVDADEPFNPVPLKELVQTPNKEDLFGKNYINTKFLF